ncbi:MAG: hypothetical protein AMK70_08530 [Nitrospira bacterium SG8_35_1]|nr:MAG: hypothetical protein AMK70_08530 [Nitrospira bacterium SG8_35_1]
MLTCEAVAKEKIRIKNGHFFEYNGKPIILIGDSATQSVMQNLNVNYKAWLDALAANQVNAALIWAWMAVPQTVDGLLVDRRYGYVVPDITPWVRSGKGSANDGKSLWDLTKFDRRYWDRIQNLVDYAESKGIVIVISVFDGWPKSFWSHPFNDQNGGPIPSEIVHSKPKVFTKRWLKSIVTRSRNMDGRQQFWTLSEYQAEMLGRSYDQSWPWELKNQYFQEKFAEKLLQVTCNNSNVIYELVNEGSSNKLYDDHWIRFFNKRCDSLIIINDDYTPFDARSSKTVDAISWHSHSMDTEEINYRWLKGFRNQPAKPVINSETVPGYYSDSPSVDDFRKIIWSTAMAGGSIFVQDDTVFAFDPESPQKPKGEILRKYLGVANKFFNASGIRIDQMIPHNRMINKGNAFALISEGKEYIIYVAENDRIDVDLSDMKGLLEAEWYDPSEGIYSERFIVHGGGSVSFDPPFSEDAALYMKVKNQEVD